MSDTVNVTEAISTFTDSLNANRTALSGQLETLDQQRADLVKQMSVIDRTLAALSGKPMPNEKADGSTGKKWKMSDEGRARISAALKARSERLAAEKAEGKVSEVAAAPSSAPAIESGVVAEAAPTTEAVPAKKPAKKAVADAK